MSERTPFDYNAVVLKDSYQKVLEAVEARPDDFSAKELASVEPIKEAASFVSGSSFSGSHNYSIPLVNKVSSRPGSVFYGDEQDMRAYPELIDVISAHEFKHASLFYNQSLGLKNINVTSLLEVVENKEIQFKERGGRHDNEAAKLRGELGPNAWLSPKFYQHVLLAPVCKAVGFVLQPLTTALIHKEEDICDAFSVRAKPDIDLDIYKQYLHAKTDEKFAGLDSNAADIVKLAETARLTIDNRHDRMKKVQEGLRSKK